MQILSAFYDLKVSSITFDIFEFLYQAEIERLNGGFDALDVIIVADETNGGFRKETVGSISIAEQRWRLRNLLLPASSLLTHARRSIYCPARTEAECHFNRADAVFPSKYSLNEPVAGFLPSELLVAMYQEKKLGTFQAPPAARAAAHDWIQSHSGGRKPIVITLIDENVNTSRNSNFEAWEQFIQWLNKDEYFAILIPDAASLFGPSSKFLEEINRFELGALDLQLRLAMYESAYLNMIQSSGPGTLCFLDNSTRALRFKMLTRGDEPPNYASFGLQWGMQWPNTNTYQKSVWEEATFKTLVSEFEKMVEIIESDIAPSTRTLPDVYQTISLFLAGGNANSAKTLLHQLLKHDPNDNQAMLLLAKTLCIQEDYSQAVETFRKVDSIAEDNADVYAGWGISLLRNHQFTEAIAKLSRAIEIGTSDPLIPIELADAYSSISRHEDALPLLRRSFDTLERDEVDIFGWEVGRRLVIALLATGAAKEANEITGQLRIWFRHCSKITTAIDAFEDSIDS